MKIKSVVNRLKKMPAREICYRSKYLSRDFFTYIFNSLSFRNDLKNSSDFSGGTYITSPFGFSNLWKRFPFETHATLKAQMLSYAEKILNHSFVFWGKEFQVGQSIDWNQNIYTGENYPLTYFPEIFIKLSPKYDYIKYTWELNRHQHLPILAIAYRISSHRCYLNEILDQVDSWIGQCPYKRGVNWADALEVSLRLISWLFTLDILDDAINTNQFSKWIYSLFQHIDFIDQHYSLFTSGNNHLIGQAVAVYLATHYFPERKGHILKHKRAKEILATAIEHQINPDGLHIECATHYHLVVFEALAMSYYVSILKHDFFQKSFWERLIQSAKVTQWFLSPGFSDPHIGDNDGGIFINPGYIHEENRYKYLLQLSQKLEGTSIVSKKDFDIPKIFLQSLCNSPIPKQFISKNPSRLLLKRSGLLIYYSRKLGNQRFRLIFNFTPTGDKNTGAHGHADALSFCLDVLGQPIFIDAGTYHYQDDKERKYFKGTRAHNTLYFDNHCQSEYLSSFLWGKKALVKMMDFEENEEILCITAEVNWWTGYHHNRELTIYKNEDKIRIRDSWKGNNPTIGFTIHPDVNIELRKQSSALYGDSYFFIISSEGQFQMESVNISTRFGSLKETTRLILRPQKAESNIVTWIEWKK